MTPEKELALQKHLNAISEIFYEEIDSNDLNNLEKIEIAVREQVLSHVSPKICVFLSNHKLERIKDEKEL